ncbi:MAG: ABC transporter ATP-binding protein/permease [Victivallaceae bacterium]|nr:ABC transporter ATP-binding protein/permease [Victivallaceae bacterium]
MADKKNENFNFTQLVAPYRWLIAGATLSLVMFSNLGMVMPWMMKITIDRVLQTGDYELLFILAMTVMLVFLVRSLMRYTTAWLSSYTGMRILLDIRQRLFKHLQSLSLRFYEEYRTGKLISNVLTDVSMINLLIDTIKQLVNSVMMIIVLTVLLFFINTPMAFCALAILPLQCLNFIYFKRVLKKGHMHLREHMSEVSANLSETLSGIKVVKSFGMERAESRSFFSSLLPTLDMTLKINSNGAYLWIISDILNVITQLLVIWVGVGQVSSGQITIGEFVAFYAYVGMFLNPINTISNLSASISQGLAGSSRIVKLLNTIPDIKEVEHPLKLSNIQGRVKFDNVSFGYKSDKPVVNDFSLTIEPGQKVALVGPSGSGKSTITNLLLRFYDPDNGKITVDGKDIKRLKFDSYRQHIGIVLQESFLFSGSIRDNIAYAKKESNSEEIENAGKMANIEEFTDKFDEGYDTKVGENGTALSGGQRQRIAIARAILKDPAILILDEATSALDTVSEKLVQEALDNLMKDRTTIIIAHRLSTIKNADIIVVMDEGRIKQVGSHAELVDIPGVYHNMYEAQSKVR